MVSLEDNCFLERNLLDDHASKNGNTTFTSHKTEYLGLGGCDNLIPFNNLHTQGYSPTGLPSIGRCPAKMADRKLFTDL